MTAFKILLALVLTAIIAGLLFIYSGVYNVAATKPHGTVTGWVLQTTQEQSVRARAQNIIAPASLSDDERFTRGAQSYGAMCEICHLAPGVEPTPLYSGLRPRPPLLSEVAANQSSEYLFWAIKHGIRMTGMPAWGETHSDDSLWDIVAFIKRLPQVTPQQYAELTADADAHEHHQHEH